MTGKLSAAQQPKEARAHCLDLCGELCAKAYFSVAAPEFGWYSRGGFVQCPQKPPLGILPPQVAGPLGSGTKQVFLRDFCLKTVGVFIWIRQLNKPFLKLRGVETFGEAHLTEQNNQRKVVNP